MKRFIATILAVGFLTALPALAPAQGPGMMGYQNHMDNDVPDQEYYRHMQERMRNNFSSNMKGNYGMMPKDEGYYGMPPCSVNGGFNMMGHHEMMPPMMVGPGFMGGPAMMQGKGPEYLKKYETFANETRELRKKLHDLMFDYGEARWNPATTVGELNKMAEEMYQLRQKIQKKLPE